MMDFSSIPRRSEIHRSRHVALDTKRVALDTKRVAPDDVRHDHSNGDGRDEVHGSGVGHSVPDARTGVGGNAERCRRYRKVHQEEYRRRNRERMRARRREERGANADGTGGAGGLQSEVRDV